MKNLLHSSALFFIAVLFSSCSHFSSLSVEKRHFRNGYHFDHVQKVRMENGTADSRKLTMPEKAMASAADNPGEGAGVSEIIHEIPSVNAESGNTVRSGASKKTSRSVKEKKSSNPSIINISKPFTAVKHAPAIMERIKKNNDGNGWIIVLILIILILWILGRFVFIVDLIDLLLLILLILLIIWLIRSI